MRSKETQTLFDIFHEEGVEIYLVGGAVRNFLLKEPIKDIDFAVACPPEDTQAILEKHDIRNIPTGLSHGTITAVLNSKPYEITSFRKDVITDGRHAKTEFGTSLKEDAMRRDFTLNAIYMDREKEIIDIVGGLEDIEKGELCFIGDPNLRIQEDYLRMLRYFRFLAEYDLYGCVEAINASKLFAPELKQISAERIGGEMRKLLAGKNALVAADEAYVTGLFELIWPEYDGARFAIWDEYRKVHALAQDWRVALVGAVEELPIVDRWRLSKAEQKFVKTLDKARHSNLKPLHLGEEFAEDIALWAWHLRNAFAGQSPQAHEQEEIARGAKAVFPLNGNDLRALGAEGLCIGHKLRALKAEWRKSDYRLDKASLIALVHDK